MSQNSLSGRFQTVELLESSLYRTKYLSLDRESNVRIELHKIGISMSMTGIPAEILRETSALQELRHPNIVELRDILISSSDFFLIFESVGNDLRKFLNSNQQIPPQTIARIIQQILEALSYCHSHQYLHRDVKPENILIDGLLNAKLTGFSAVRPTNELITHYTSDAQTLWYRSPEVLLEANKYDFEVDVWSAGCIFAEMLIGKPIFPGGSSIDQIIQICKLRGTPTEDTWPGVTGLKNYPCLIEKFPRRNLSELIEDTQAIDLLDKMLEMDPAQRISAVMALNHPYFYNLVN